MKRREHIINLDVAEDGFYAGSGADHGSKPLGDARPQTSIEEISLWIASA